MKTQQWLQPRRLGYTLFTLLWLLTLPAKADLTVTVTPGYQFSPLERPTVDTLNALGIPTITVSGTLGGTNVAIAAGSITGTMLSGTVVDGVTLDFDGSSPRAIEIMTQGVYTNNLNTNDFGQGLAGGLDTKVHVVIDANTIQTNVNGQLYVNTTNLALRITISPTNTSGITNSIIGAGADGLNTNLTLGNTFTISNGVLRLTHFVSTNVNITAHNGFTLSLPHGLSNAPTVLRWVLVCTTAELGYSVGDELDLSTVGDSGSGSVHWNYGANSTNAFIVARNNNNIQLYNFTTQGTGSTITLSSWKFKCYAYP